MIVIGRQDITAINPALIFSISNISKGRLGVINPMPTPSSRTILATLSSSSSSSLSSSSSAQGRHLSQRDCSPPNIIIIILEPASFLLRSTPASPGLNILITALARPP